jgi:hypothetical protein
MKRDEISRGNALLAAALLISLACIVTGAEAVTYFSMRPGTEYCDKVYFGNDGRGEYVMTASDPGYPDTPWIDNHFTSFFARSENVITVPVCFNTIGRNYGEEAVITLSLKTPNGQQTLEYGVCVSDTRDVEITEVSAGEEVCSAMAMHTDIFSAALAQPEQDADPEEQVSYKLILDSSTPVKLNIARASGQMDISASEVSVDITDSLKEVTLTMQAPSSPGDYEFSVMVSVDGCEIDDCMREVKGKVHVKGASEEPKGSFYLWIAPKTQNTMGRKSKTFVLTLRNFGPGQKITVSAAPEDGLETNFEPYTIYLNKDESKEINLNVMPETNEQNNYKVTVSAVGEDGTKRTVDGWVTVDEMVADASKLGQDEFVDKYKESGEATLPEWVAVNAVTGAVSSPENGENGGGVTPGPPGPENWIIYVVIAVVVAVILIVGLFYYKRIQAQGGGEVTWESLGS